MTVEVLVLKESAPGERRVAATPETVKKLVAAGASIKIESGAGLGAGFVDQAYLDVVRNWPPPTLLPRPTWSCAYSRLTPPP